MSDDKRKVSTDALETLGTIIGPDEKRDAIHLAVIPMQAKHRLISGEHVGADGTENPPHVGIVDPFLNTTVYPGDWFWLVIYPRQITSLRHVWSHPAFPEEQGTTAAPITKEFSEKWLREWVRNSECPSYDWLLRVGREGDFGSYMDPDGPGAVVYDDYLTVLGSDASGEIPPEVWDHVENVIGKKVPYRPTYFSCSC